MRTECPQAVDLRIEGRYEAGIDPDAAFRRPLGWSTLPPPHHFRSADAQTNCPQGVDKLYAQLQLDQDVDAQ